MMTELKKVRFSDPLYKVQPFYKTDPPNKINTMLGGGLFGGVGVGVAFYQFIASLIVTIILLILTVGDAIFDGVGDLVRWIKGTPKPILTTKKPMTTQKSGSGLTGLAIFTVIMSIITTLLYFNYKEVKKHPGLAEFEGVDDVANMAVNDSFLI